MLNCVSKQLPMEGNAFLLFSWGIIDSYNNNNKNNALLLFDFCDALFLICDMTIIQNINTQNLNTQKNP